MIATGPEASKVWVLPHSRKYAYTTEDSEPSLAMHLRPKLVEIPSFSVLVGRGDLIPAGVCAQEMSSKLCLRYHVYLQRKGMSLPDAIITNQSFKLSVYKLLEG